MWPISMPELAKPVNSLPLHTIPPPMPVPSVTITAGSQPLAAPAQYSPTAAQLASLPRNTGTSHSLWNISRRGTFLSEKGMLGFWTNRPSLLSTTPGRPIPTVSICSEPILPTSQTCRASRTSSAPNCMAVISFGTGLLTLFKICPFSSTSPATKFVPPTSIPI